MKEQIKLSTQEVSSLLEKAGVNATAQRIAICKYVICHSDHPSADDVKNWVDENFPKMSLATVYNTLNILVEAELLKEFRFPHTEKVIYDNNLSKHYHFYDESTGVLEDISADQIKIESPLFKLLNVTDIDVVIRGRSLKNKKIQNQTKRRS